ncbi:MAG: carboxypeptidase-like regulatory domain-containing protein [Dysgonamonadaceae bacterium]|nr:carboxypeptidase-like regulatory domain-containing protein [Dysgonamonadaceae bacterium]
MFFAGLKLSSQVRIEGIVTGKSDKNPVEGVIVAANNKDGSVSYSFKLTNKDGKFSLQFSSREDSVFLHFSLLGYESRRLVLPNKSTRLNVILASKDFQLKEVRIRPPDISMHEDTLNFRVDAFVRDQDRNIGDVLKRLPGIEVTSGGTVKYNGENINKYYIEGLDLLGNRYSIANKNISPQDIVNVQVIENHQPVKVLKEVVHSQQAAINLQLKKNKIAKPTGNIDVGTGFYPLLWKFNSFAMDLAKERQTIVTYKTNNAGKDIASELNPHSLSMDNIRSINAEIPNDLIHSPYLSTPPTTQERYLFNKTHILSVNHLKKTGQDSQLKLNINYLNNDQQQKLHNVSAYYFASSDTNLVIDESNILDRYTNQLDAVLSYTLNSRKYYMDNSLKFSGIWNSSQSSVAGINNVEQRFRTPLFYVRNDWSAVKIIQSKIVQFSSLIRYSRLPQQLGVKMDSITGEITQHAGLSNFYTSNSATYGFLWRTSSLRFDFNIQAYSDDLNSSTDHLPLSIVTDNHIKSDKWIYNFTPKYNYKPSAKLNMDFSLPVSFNTLSSRDVLQNTKENFDFLFVNPSVSVVFRWNSLWSNSLSYNYDNYIGDIMDFTNAYIMTNYRSFHRGSGILSKRSSQSYRLHASYRDAIAGLFANMGITRRKTRSNLLNETDFTGIYSLFSAIESPNNSDSWLVSGNISKYVSSILTSFSLNSSYNYLISKQIQQGTELEWIHKVTSLRPKIDTKITDELNVSYILNYANIKTQIKPQAGKKNPSINQVSHFFTVNAFPSKQWILKGKMEYYRSQLSSNSYANLFFADLSVLYKTKKIEYSLDWTNIFDQKRYSYTQYNGPNTVSTGFDLRPMNFLLSLSFRY